MKVHAQIWAFDWGSLKTMIFSAYPCLSNTFLRAALPGVWKQGQSCPRTRSSEDLPIPLGPGEVATIMKNGTRQIVNVLEGMEFWSLWIGRCWFCLVMPPFDPCPSQTACTVAITMSSKATKKPATCEQCNILSHTKKGSLDRLPGSFVSIPESYRPSTPSGPWSNNFHPHPSWGWPGGLTPTCNMTGKIKMLQRD